MAILERTTARVVDSETPRAPGTLALIWVKYPWKVQMMVVSTPNVSALRNPSITFLQESSTASFRSKDVFFSVGESCGPALGNV